MDNATIIISALFLGVGALPFYLSFTNRKRREKGLIKDFKEAIGDSQVNISRFEIMGNRMLAIDNDNKKLHLFRGSTSPEIETIDLKEIRLCTVSTDYSRSALTESAVNEIDRISIVFNGTKDGNQKSMVLYSRKHNGALDGEIQIANTWSSLINSLIKSSH